MNDTVTPSSTSAPTAASPAYGDPQASDRARPGPGTRGRALPAAWLGVTRWTAAAHTYIAFFVLVGGAVLIGIGLLVTSRFWTPNVSFAQFAGQIMVWIPLAMAASMIYTQVGVFLAHGATRRAIVRGQLASAPLGALAWAVAGTLLLRLEATVYRLAGWTHLAGVGDDGVAEAGQWADGWWRYLLVRWLLILAAILGGAVTGAAFYRLTGGRAILAILLVPFTIVLPVLGVSTLLQEQNYGFLGRWFEVPQAVGWAGMVGVLVALAVGLWLLLRDVAVRPRAA